MSKPEAEIFDAAAVRTPPDLGQVIAVTIVSLMLHAELRVLEQTAFRDPKLARNDVRAASIDR